jgi:non-ribosomal peptide synthetase component F
MASATKAALDRNHQCSPSDSSRVAAWRRSNGPLGPGPEPGAAVAATRAWAGTRRTVAAMRARAATMASPSRPSLMRERSSPVQRTATSWTWMPSRAARATISTSQARWGSREKGRMAAQTSAAAALAPHWVSIRPGARVSWTSRL